MATMESRIWVCACTGAVPNALNKLRKKTPQAAHIDAPQLVLYRAADVPFAGSCGVQHTPQQRALAETLRAEAGSRRASGTGLEVIELGVDADHTFFVEQGYSVSASMARVESIVNGMNADYEVPGISLTIEITVLISGILLGGTFGIGTIAYVLAIGPLVQHFLPRWTIDLRTA